MEIVATTSLPAVDRPNAEHGMPHACAKINPGQAWLGEKIDQLEVYTSLVRWSTSNRVVATYFRHFCQVQSQLQLSWTELALISTLTLPPKESNVEAPLP